MTNAPSESSPSPSPISPTQNNPLLAAHGRLASFFKGKRILVTGHTGFKGSWLWFILKEWGADVHGYALEPYTTDTLYKIFHHDKDPKSIIGDITDKNHLRDVLQQVNPEIVFHLAAQPILRESYDKPIETFHANTIGTLNLADELRQCPAVRSVVFITTDKVYENNDTFVPFRESDMLGGSDPYSASKACAELIVKAYRKSFFKEKPVSIVTARAGNVIGGGDWSKDRIVPDIVRSAFQTKAAIELRQPHAIRPWQHVLEPLFGYLMLAKRAYEQQHDLPTAWNFGPESDHNIPVEQITREGYRILKAPFSWNVVPDNKKHEHHFLTLDSTLAKQVLGWSPQLSFEETLNWTFLWYKAYYDNADMIALTRLQLQQYEERVEKNRILHQIHTLIDEYHAVTSKPLPTHKVPITGKVYDAKELHHLVAASLEGWWTEGAWATKFEQLLAEFLGTKHAIIVNSGSSANLLAFGALCSPKLKDRRIKPGDEIITVAAGFPTTINPMVQYGAIPVFVDVELGHYNTTFQRILRAYSPKTKAIMIAHTLGNPYDVAQIAAFCKEKGLWFIEDNCDALGATYQGQKTGTFGDISTSSFYPAHHITTAEGGAVFTQHAQLAKIIRSLRDWGRDCWCATGKDDTCHMRYQWKLGNLPEGYDHKYIYSELGYNLKMTDLTAALGCAQMEKLPQFIEIRRKNFAYLLRKMEPFKDYFILPAAVDEYANPSWFGFPLTINDARIERKKILDYLNKNGVATRLLFAGNVTKQPYFVSGGFPYRIAEPLVNTDRIMEQMFWVGIYPALTEQHLDHMVRVFGEFLAQFHVEKPVVLQGIGFSQNIGRNL